MMKSTASPISLSGEGCPSASSVAPSSIKEQREVDGADPTQDINPFGLGFSKRNLTTSFQFQDRSEYPGNFQAQVQSRLDLRPRSQMLAH
jgi:hypothetical protein